MTYTVALLKNSVSAILSGLNLNNVQDLNGDLERAARTLTQKADIIDASGRAQFTLYDHVYDYLAPVDIFGGAVFDFKPQGISRSPWDGVYRQLIETFDITKAYLPNGVQLTFEYNKGVPIMRVASARTTSRAVLDPMTDISGWTAAGTASGLTADATDYYESPNSLRFTLTGAGTGTLTKTIAAGDMSTYQRVAVVFLALKIPSTASAASLLSSVAIRLGSSASAYTTVTTTTGYLGAFTLGEWLLVALDLSTGTDTGTPNYSNITYLQVQLATSATITNFRVGGIWASLPNPYTLLYGSSAFFIPTTSTTPQMTITNDNDSIVLSPATYTLYQWECAKEIAIAQGGTLASGMVQMIEQRLSKDLYPSYLANNQSQQVRVNQSYYNGEDNRYGY